jgi:hypothetical protein
MHKISYVPLGVILKLLFRCLISFLKLRIIILSLLFFSSSIAYSQKYKTIQLEKEKKVSGVVWYSDMPTNTADMSLLTKKTKSGSFQKYDSTIRKSNKVILFKFNTNEFRNREILFINIVTKNTYPLLNKTPLVSAFFDTASDSKTFKYSHYNYNFSSLKSNHVVSIEIDTTQSFLYLVLLFPQSFSDGFKYEIETKTKPMMRRIKSPFNFDGQQYFHPYDYKNKPPFFVEASVLSKQKDRIQAKIRLDNPAFEEPSVKVVNDSVFFDTLMKKFIELAIKENIVKYCEYPRVLFQLKFDQLGNLKDIKLSSFEEPYPPLTSENVKTLIHLLEQAIPNYFIWKPAKNMYDKNIPFTKEFLLYMDMCWN